MFTFPTAQAAQAAADVALAVIAVVSFVRFYPVFRSHIILAQENTYLRAQSARNLETIRTMNANADGWRDAAERISAELQSVRDELKDLRHKNALQTQYICDLISYLKKPGPYEQMPPIPGALQDDISDGLHDARAMELHANLGKAK